LKTVSKLAERRAGTRRKLLEATLDTIQESGLHGVSVDGVARRVGVTKGAVYDNFENKDAMIIAALKQLPKETTGIVSWPVGKHGSVRERLRRLGEAMLAGRGSVERDALATAELALYALKHPELRARLAEIPAFAPDRVGEALAELFEPDDLTVPLQVFAALVRALIPGLTQTRAVSLSPPAPETILQIFESFAAPAK
jgi:AcrR family transcriptional regulator